MFLHRRTLIVIRCSDAGTEFRTVCLFYSETLKKKIEYFSKIFIIHKRVVLLQTEIIMNDSNFHF